MKFRSNKTQSKEDLKLQEAYLKKLLLVSPHIYIQEEHMKNRPKSQANSGPTSVSSTSASVTRSVCGLNNLGNTCFFNAVLQNLAQTPFLLQLLKENFATLNKTFLIKENCNYDSELSDYEYNADGINENGPSECKDDCIDNNDNDDGNWHVVTRSKKKATQSTENVSCSRSMHLNELSICINEHSGPLTKQLFELVRNMSHSKHSETKNPSGVFSLVCKKVPSFKGFQQQDSHELLRNLLDAVKTEELKRRQAEILKSLGAHNNQKNIDDQLKRKIKRYGRLASYTFIDKLFGGHLLSSIVCEECKTCSQRVEPFLDLSLPIVDNEPIKSAVSLITNSLANGSNRFANTTLKLTKGKIKAVSKDVETETNVATKKLSKHQQKKLQKEALKKNKKSKSKENAVSFKKDDDDSTNETDIKPESVDEIGLDVKQTEKHAEHDEDKVTQLADSVSALNMNEKTKCDEFNSTCKQIKKPVESNHQVKDNETNDDTSNNKDDDNDDNNESTDTDGDDEEDDIYNETDKESVYLNNFRLEAMKNAACMSSTNHLEELSLERCLAKFTSNELLNEKLSCDHCKYRHYNERRLSFKCFMKQQENNNATKLPNVYTKALKQYLICELPAVLTIHIKRFQQHGTRLEKSNKHVSFPLVLDMSPYTSQMCVNLLSVDDDDNNEDANSKKKKTSNRALPALYSLYGLVEHSGRLNSGHYTAYVKANPRSSIDSLHLMNESESRRRLFLGKRRLCHLNSMLAKWNGKYVQHHTLDEAMQMMRRDMSMMSDGKVFNDYLPDKVNDEDKSAPVDESVSEATRSGDEKWYYVSDSSVNEVNVAKVLKAQAYILFYERIQ